MNLLQLSAMDVTAWPDGAECLIQSERTGRIMFDADHGYGIEHDFEATEIADDAHDATITRAQWEAERARIAAMEGASAFSQEQEISEARREKIAKEWWDKQMQYQPLMVIDIPLLVPKNYEQELWDEVAQGWIQGASSDTECSWSKAAVQGHVELAYDVADAFMAERAKRLKGAK